MFRIATVLAGLTLSLACMAPAAAQESYPMMCKAGGAMRVGFVSGPSTDPGLGRSLVMIYGVAAPVAATSPDALAPGQCSWLDRPLNSSERAILVYQPARGEALNHAVLVEGGRVVNVDFTGSGAAPGMARSLWANVNGGGVFTVMVYNNRGDHMVVTALR